MDKNELPQNWIRTTIGNISHKPQYGYTTKSSKSRGDIKYIRTTDISKGQIDWDKVPFCTVNPDNIEKYILNEGDIIVSRAGSIGISYLLEEVPLKAVFASYLIRFKPIIVKPKFIKYYLDSPAYWDLVSGASAGIAVQNINATKLSNFEINLPPKLEQDRIVAKLDRLMGRVETMQKGLERIPKLLKDFRQQVLTQAVTGKLTKEWRKEKDLVSVMDLITRINHRRQNHKSKKVQNLRVEIRKDIELYELPESWKWIDLNYLIDENDKFRYGVVQPGKDIREQKLIRVKDLSNGKIQIDKLRGISNEIDESYSTARVKTGDLLVSIVGTIGRTAIVSEESNGFNIARAIAKVPVKDISTYYLRYFVDSYFGQKWLIGDAREVARKTLNLEQLKTLPLPIPSQDEQNEIVKRVENLFAKAELIEKKYYSLKTKIDSLPQAVLNKAFKGELVEQLPTDGDARALLEEIEKPKKNKAKL
tara:strand:- start:2518 stop:3948 length:1431 start_codon:yes stop_codon:yes gene_type:complete